MSIFQVICIVALVIEAVLFVLHIFLDVQGSHEADMILHIFACIAIAIGFTALMAGAIGQITI